MRDDGLAVVDEFLAERDEESGLFYMDLTSGRQLAFAPSPDVEPGEACLIDLDQRTSRTVPLETVMQGSAPVTVFLMSEYDFERLLEQMMSGKMKPIYAN